MIFGVMLLAGCTSATVMSSYNADPDADFAAFKTYAWDVPLNKAVKESYNPMVNNTFVEKQLKEAIALEMNARGYKRVALNPDLLVNFHTMVQSKSDITTYPNNYYFWWRNDVQTINYEEGTLIIDLIDATKDQLVWQGYASNELKRDELPNSLEIAVKSIFEKYPYRAGIGEVVSRKK